jgi:hypothetical protein
MAVALRVMNRQPLLEQAVALSVPQHHRTWPMVELEVEVHGAHRRLKYYVCSKAAVVTEASGFPVGTTFVVENYRAEPRGGPVQESLVSQFVMRKYASVISDQPGQTEKEAWCFAAYGSDGEVVFSGCKVLQGVLRSARKRRR